MPWQRQLVETRIGFGSLSTVESMVKGLKAAGQAASAVRKLRM